MHSQELKHLGLDGRRHSLDSSYAAQLLNHPHSRLVHILQMQLVMAGHSTYPLLRCCDCSSRGPMGHVPCNNSMLPNTGCGSLPGYVEMPLRPVFVRRNALRHLHKYSSQQAATSTRIAAVMPHHASLQSNSGSCLDPMLMHLSKTVMHKAGARSSTPARPKPYLTLGATGARHSTRKGRQMTASVSPYLIIFSGGVMLVPFSKLILQLLDI